MSHIPPFCPACGAFFPAGQTCLACGRTRSRLRTPSRPGTPLWTATLPDAPAFRPALARVDGRTLLLLPWGSGESGKGGVVALDTADGSIAWETPLDLPVNGGVAVALDAGLAVIGLAPAWRSGGAGAIAALDLRTGKEDRWPARAQVGGIVEAAPVVDEARVYVGAGDGRLYCRDLRTGCEVWQQPVDGDARRIPAPPALLIERGVARAIVVATYGTRRYPDAGLLVAFDASGRRLWPAGVDLGGAARGAPVIAQQRVYVASYAFDPPAGRLMAFDLLNGRLAWPEPFVVPARRGVNSGLVAAPLVAGNTIYAGSQDHRLYAVDAATGKQRWPPFEAAHGIVSAPAWAEGLVVFGARGEVGNDRVVRNGRVHAVDGMTGEPAWTYEIGGHVFAAILSHDGALFAASSTGAVAALPWHGGRYDWAAERLAAGGRTTAAGDCWALAGHFSARRADQELHYRRASGMWYEADAYERAAEMWSALGKREKRWLKDAADAWREAGLVQCSRAPDRAAVCLTRAAEIYHHLRLAEPLNQCTRALASCIDAPYVQARLLNPGSFVQWEASELTLRLENENRAVVKNGIRLGLGGGLKSYVNATLPEDLGAGASWHVPLKVTPIRPNSILEVEIEYDSGQASLGTLRGLWQMSVDAVEQPRPIIFHDVGQVTIAGQTTEGVKINVEGDVGGIIARGPIAQVRVAGDVAMMKGVDTAQKAEIVALSERLNATIAAVNHLQSRDAGIDELRRALDGLAQQVTEQRLAYGDLSERLTGDAQAAMGQVGTALDALTARLEALAQRPAEPEDRAPRARPVDPAAGSWARQPDELAIRIEASDLSGFLARELVIEPGTCAFFMEDGSVTMGQVGPGAYALDTLLDRMPGMRGMGRVTAIVAVTGEVSLPLALSGLRTADGASVNVQADLCFQLADALSFFVNFMQGRERVVRSDLAGHLLPEVRDAAGEWAGARPKAELSGALAHKDALAAAVEAHLGETLAALGLRFMRVRALATK